MSKAHQNSNVLLVGRPNVIDSQSTAYWSFNSGLVSQGYPVYPLVDPVSRLFSNAVNAVPGYDQGYNTTGLLVPGKFGNGITRDEATTNLIQNGNVPVDTARWSLNKDTAGGAVASFSRVVDPIMGTCVEYTYTTAGGWGAILQNDLSQYMTDPYFDTLQQYTISFYAKRILGGGNLNVSIRNPNGNNLVLTTTVCTLSSGWQFYSITFTPLITGVGPVVYMTVSAGVGFRMTNLQMEQKPYYTPFVNGTRDEKYIVYPWYAAKTLSIWVKSNSNKVPTGGEEERTIAHQIDNLGSYPFWQLFAANASSGDFYPGTAISIPAGRAVLKVKLSASDTLVAAVSSVNICDGSWHHITIELGVTSYNSASQVYRILVDDKLDSLYSESTAIPAGLSTLFEGNIRLGYKGNQAGNFTLDDLRMDILSYGKDDILRRYMANTEYYDPYSYGVTC